jgi:hypothetical protein
MPYSISPILFNPAKTLIFEQWSPDLSRYTRAQGVKYISKKQPTLKLMGFESGGNSFRLGAQSYQLYIDDILHCSASPGPTDLSSVIFTLDVEKIKPGVRVVKAQPSIPTGESCIPYFIVVEGVSTDDKMPIVSGSYSVAMSNTAHIASVPNKYSPRTVTFPTREYVEFNTTLRRDQLHCAQIVPVRSNDTYRPSIADGKMVSAATQSYHFFHMVAAKPLLPLLDGPRGVGTAQMLTHIELGNAVINGKARHAIYAADPWRIMRIGEDGTITTLAGYRHKNNPTPHWQSSATTTELDLVGDWSDIPVERRGFHEIWGIAWDERTFSIDPTKLINGENPHINGPVMFVADSQNGRIIKLEFSPTSREAQPKVTEFATGLKDPWDCVASNGVLYVSERGLHRILAIDMDTKKIIRTLVAGPAMAATDKNRQVQLYAPRTFIQQQACVLPEGLFLQDGYIYFGSVAMAQVRRVPITASNSPTSEFVCNMTADNNALFAKIALSDGTFGPKGTVGICKWSNLELGMPEFRTPGDKRWNWWDGSSVGAGAWSQFTYPTAVCMSFGRCLVGGVNEGLLVVSKSLTGETFDSVAAAGEGQWRKNGYILTHGHGGWSFYPIELPWGKSPEIDAYLRLHGHTR